LADQALGKVTSSLRKGYERITLGHPVLWLPPSTLVQRLLAAKRDLHLPQELATLDRFACLILDDLGDIQHDRGEMEVLFPFFSERSEHTSLMLSTNLVFSEWERIFKHPMTAFAAIDRIVHHSVILDMMEVERYRATEATIRERAQEGNTEAARVKESRGTRVVDF
jgi:DNA replication protein DnaC